MKVLTVLLLSLLMSCQEAVEVEQINLNKEASFDVKKLSQENEQTIDLSSFKSQCAQDNYGTGNYYKGILRETVVDFNDKSKEHSSTHYYLELDKKTIINIEPTLMAKIIPKNEERTFELAASTKKGLEEGSTIVRDMTNSLRAKGCSSSKMIGKFVSNPNKAIYLIYRSDSFREIPKNSQGRAIESFYSNLSQGQYSVTVRTFRMNYEVNSTQCYAQNGGTNCLINLRNHAESVLTANGIPFTNQTYFALYGSSGGGGINGLGQINGHLSITFGGGTGTLLHEIGHNFGLRHASKLQPNGSISEYGDSSSVMGSSNSQNRVNALQLDQLNLLASSQKKIINQTEQILLSPIDMNESVVAPTKQVAVLNKNGETFYISTRAGGTPWVQSNLSNRVFIHKTQSSQHSLLVDDIDEGEELVYNGVKIQFIDSQGDIARVNVFRNVSDSAPALIAFPSGPTMSCTGQIPVNANLCSGDDMGLSQNVERLLQSSCTARKCEYTCQAGFVLDDLGTSCIPEDSSGVNYFCEGQVPANSVMCPGDNQGLDNIISRSLVENCTAAVKCEHICSAGYRFETDYDPFQGFTSSCVQDQSSPEPVQITLSEGGYNGAPDTVFQMGVDHVFFKVENAGPNAKACIHYTLDNGSSDWGRCSNLSDDAPEWFVMSNQSQWEFNDGEWRKNHDFSVSNHNRHPGVYEMFWFNPDTGMRGSLEFTLE